MHAHVSVHVSVHAWGGVFAQRDMLCVPAYVYVCVCIPSQAILQPPFCTAILKLVGLKVTLKSK